MRYGHAFVVLALAGSTAGTAWGQTVADLRQQIETLQAQLQAIEQAGAASSRVTQLGSRRISESEPQLVLRIYDVSDLFTLAPPYEAQHLSDLTSDVRPLFPMPRVAAAQRTSGTGGMGGMGGGGGGGFFAVGDGRGGQPAAGDPAGGLRTSMDQLIDAITDTINPTSWDEVGGPASIAQLGTTLIISADRNSHDQIEGLLTLFRERWKTLRTISVRAHWLWLDDDQIAALLEKPEGGAESGPYGLVNEAAWRQLLNRPADEGQPQRRRYRAVVTCYNGQTVHVLSGGQSLAVTQLAMTPGEGGGQAGYQPTVAVLQEGPALQMTPLASRSGKYVVLDIHSRVNLMAEEPAAKAGAGLQPEAQPLQVVAALDRPRLVVHRLSTTLRVPVDRVALVGGMTLDEGNGPSGTLYLFVKTSIQELYEDNQPADPADAEPAEDAVDKPAEE